MSWARALRRRLGLARMVAIGADAGERVRLDGKRIYILPTRFGVLYGLLLFVMLMGSVNYSSSMGYLLTFLLASVALVSILHTYRNLRDLALAPGRFREAFAHRPVVVPVLLGSEGERRHTGIEVRGEGIDPARATLEPGGSVELRLAYAGVRRGRFRPRHWTVSTTYPLGLFRAWSQVAVARSFLVYPAPATLRLPLPTGPSYDRPGAEQGRRGSDDFTGLRPYAPGDSLRHIHWKAAARGQGLLTKEFGGDHSTEIWLDWAQLASSDAEQRLQLLCRWILEASAAGLRYGLRLPGLECPPDQGPEHRVRCLEALALWEA